jgi:hypothetical protein
MGRERGRVGVFLVLLFYVRPVCDQMLVLEVGEMRGERAGFCGGVRGVRESK